MYTNSISLKTFYTLEKLKSLSFSPKTQKKIFSLCKTLRSLTQSYSLASTLKNISHTQISTLLKKSVGIDDLLCSILKRIQKSKTLSQESFSSKSVRHIRERQIMKELQRIEKVITNYAQKCATCHSSFDYGLYPKIDLCSKGLTFSLISSSFFEMSKSLNDSSSSSDISISTSLQSSFQ